MTSQAATEPTTTPATEPAAQPEAIRSENHDRSLEGAVVACDSDANRAGAIDAAFDYRGDVTLRLADDGEATGYVSNRDAGKGELTLLTPNGDRRSIGYAEVAQVVFSGRDPAAGKTWESWLKRYVEQKAAGQRASIESEHQG
ncbi:MAG: hypothetical protein AAF842_11390 [Planctomycetota bacterium]